MGWWWGGTLRLVAKAHSAGTGEHGHEWAWALYAGCEEAGIDLLGVLRKTGSGRLDIERAADPQIPPPGDDALVPADLERLG